MLKTRLKLLSLFSAIAIAVLLGIHMAIQHLNNILVTGEADPTAWAPMMSRSVQGVWVGLYIALLAFGLYHGLYGLRGIILEVTTSSKTMRAVNWLFIIGGVAIFIWGSYVPISLLSS